MQIDCDRLDDDASELIGRGAKKGLMYWLPNEATLVLNNVHKAPASVLPILQREVSTASVAASMDEDFDFEYEFNNSSTMDGEDYGSEENDDVLSSVLDSVSSSTSSNKSTTTTTTFPTRKRLPPCRFPRIIMVAETRVPKLEEYSSVIKVPPLRVRPEDIDDLAEYLLKVLSRQKGLGKMTLTPEAMRKLEAGQYPNNVRELKAQVERAVAQTVKAAPSSAFGESGNDNVNAASSSLNSKNAQLKKNELVIGEEVFWFSNVGRDRLRLDLFANVPHLRNFVRSDMWPDQINFKFTVYAFAAIVAILFLGPQDREHNFALNAFWCYWWPLSFIAFPFVGRIWCSVCPFMIYGELVQSLRKATGAKLLKWPKAEMDMYGSWFLFSLFAVILVWEEVWDLPHSAALSSWLLLLITAGAVVGSYFYERRIWRRHLWPIGGMNGLFAKLAMTELRARQGVCSAECSTYGCYKGGPAVPPEGQETDGCPVYSHPAQLADNRNCVLCATCVKACPHSSIEFRLRVPGADIWDGTHTVMAAEVCLMFMLLGSVYLHDLPQLLTDLGVQPETLMTGKLTHIVVSVVVMGAPGLVAWCADAGYRLLAAATLPAPAPRLSPATTSNADAARAIALLQSASDSYSSQAAGALLQAPAKPFLDLSYGYLPMVWAGTLAYYLRYGITEAGHILPVAAMTFGLDPAPAWLPIIEAPQEVVGFLEGSCLLFGAALSLGMTRRVAGQPWKVVLPQCALILTFTAGLWHLILP